MSACVMDQTEPLGGMEYRRWLAETGGDGGPLRLAPSPLLRDKPIAPMPLSGATSAEIQSHRSASASEQPPFDSITDAPADRWAVDFMQRHQRAYLGTHYWSGMILSAFVQSWGVELSRVQLDPWEEFMMRGRVPGADEELAAMADAEPSQFTQCLEQMYVHDRQTYHRRIQNITLVDVREATEDLDNGQLFDLWHWCKEEAKYRDERITAGDITGRIGEILDA